MTALRPFHLAFPVRDLNAARTFYKEVLGLKEGRRDKTWVDFDFFGHQVVFHYDKTLESKSVINAVDGHGIPVPHFGVVLSLPDWKALATSLKQKQITFIVEPYIRFEGQPGEQATLFFQDPNGLNLEFKAFKSDKMLFEV